ncbi:MAG: SRPBCC family protein [Solirubrobacterales bacterium]
MIDFTIETRIGRPPEVVFDQISDPAKLHTWQTNTVSAVQEGDGQMGVGTRLREVHRMPGGKKAESVVEIAEFEPNRTLALRVVEGTPIHGRITLEPDGGGTLLRFRAYGQLTGLMRALQPLLALGLRRQFAGYCDTLKSKLENDPL